VANTMVRGSDDPPGSLKKAENYNGERLKG
jgi:hypothetical protein